MKATLQGDPVKYWPHWTAVIQEKKTGQRYAVDSWSEPNGENPAVVEVERLVHQGHQQPAESHQLAAQCAGATVANLGKNMK